MASSPALGTAEKAKIDQIVSEFFAKSLHVILESRIPDISAQSQSDDFSHHSAGFATSPSSSKASNQWFNLEFDDCPAVLDRVEPWRRGGSVEPMVIDVLLQQPMGGDIASPSGIGPRYFKGTSPRRGNSSGLSWSGEGDGSVSPRGISRTVLERWLVQYVPRQKGAGTGGGSARGSGIAGPPPFPSSHVVERPVVYKRTVIMLRSLYCTMRTLPAHRLFRLVNSSSHSRSFSLSFKVSSAPPPLSDETTMMTRDLTPVETMWGRLCVSVAYKPTTAATALEITPPILPKIIPDYVGSPTTDPLRRFPSVGSLPGGSSGRRGPHVARPSSVPNPTSVTMVTRGHSWSGGQQKYPPPSSTPNFRPSRSPPSSHPPDSHRSPPIYPASPFSPVHQPSPPMIPSPVHHPPSYPLSPSSANFPPGLSPRTSPSHPSLPPFSPSPSPSPPTPSYPFPEGGLVRGRSAPVSIPSGPSSSSTRAGVSPSPRRPRADYYIQAKIQYPPRSPSRNIDDVSRPFSGNLKHLTGGQMPNFDIPSSFGRVGSMFAISSQLAESSLVDSPPHPYHPAGEEKDGGPPSGMKWSLYGTPRVTPLGSRGPRSQDDVDEEGSLGPFFVDEDEPEDYRSSRMDLTPDAAAGALVRILRSAPPLRHGTSPTLASGSPSPRLGFPPAAGQGGRRVKGSPPRPINRGHPGSTTVIGSPKSQVGGGKFSPKTSALALDELKGYIEMRDHLRRQSGGKFQSSSPAKHL